MSEIEIAQRNNARTPSTLLGHAYRVIKIVIGFTLLLIGLALVVLPGPAFIVVPLGLGILGTEFIWAARWVAAIKRGVDRCWPFCGWKKEQKPKSD